MRWDGTHSLIPHTQVRAFCEWPCVWTEFDVVRTGDPGDEAGTGRGSVERLQVKLVRTGLHCPERDPAAQASPQASPQPSSSPPSSSSNGRVWYSARRKSILVDCCTGSYGDAGSLVVGRELLEVKELQVSGRKVVKAMDFMNGLSSKQQTLRIPDTPLSPTQRFSATPETLPRSAAA